MPIDEDTKRKITDLYFHKQKTIREIAKTVKKSSRDVIAVLKEHKQEILIPRTVIQIDNRNDDKKDVNEEKEDCNSLSVNAKAYQVFSQGLTPIQVVSELKISEADSTRYYIEYLRLKRLPKLASTLEELKVPRKIALFIQLTNLALAENMRATQVLQLLNMANSRGMHNIEQNIKNHRMAITNLRKTRQDEGLELVALNQKINSAKGILNQYNLAIKEKQEVLAAILEEKIKYERMVELFRLNNETYLKIQRIAKDKVNGFLTEHDGRKLLEFALMAVAEAIRQDAQKNLLIDKTPSLQNYNFASEKSPFPNPWDDYGFPHTAKEKVLELSTELYNKLVKGLTDVTISTAAGIVGKDSSANFYSY